MKLELTAVVLSAMLIIPQGLAQASFSSTAPRTTPDNFFYGLNVAIDKISLLLTFDNTARAQKGLEIAHERLLEVRQMVAENKLDAAKRAAREYNETLGTVESTIKTIRDVNKTEVLRRQIRLETEFENYENVATKILGNVTVRVKGNVSQDIVDSIINSLGNRTARVKVEIESGKDRVRLEIRQSGKSDEDINETEHRLERQEGLVAIREERAREMIADVKEKLADVRTKVYNSDAIVKVSVLRLLNESESRLAKAETAYNQKDYGAAFGQANAAYQLVKNANMQLENRLEIKSQVSGNSTRVTVKNAGGETEFTVDATSKDAVVSRIVDRTGLSKTDVERAVSSVED